MCGRSRIYKGRGGEKKKAFLVLHFWAVCLPCVYFFILFYCLTCLCVFGPASLWFSCPSHYISTPLYRCTPRENRRLSLTDLHTVIPIYLCNCVTFDFNCRADRSPVPHPAASFIEPDFSVSDCLDWQANCPRDYDPFWHIVKSFSNL